MVNKSAAIARYHELLEEIKVEVPQEKLLIFTVDQGWEPLCKFLGVDIPETDFPNVNDRTEIKKTIADMTKGAYLFLTIGVLALAGIIYGLIKFLG